MTRRVLCVDDEPNVLSGIKRQLRNHFELDCAIGGLAALELLAGGAQYAVIVTDMRMPEMNGIQLLKEIRRVSPDTTRLMLTGNADLQTAIDAVNRGNVFRFLNKPCTEDDLKSAIETGLEQHRLITAERELLSKTLAGCMSLLTDLLSSANPAAFGRALRLRKWAGMIANHLNADAVWEIEIAALASQIGLLAIPDSIGGKVLRGERLNTPEQSVLDSHPEIGGKLLRRIPRLENVANIVARQRACINSLTDSDEALPLGARILKVCLDFDSFVSSGHSIVHALDVLYSRQDWYDPQILSALSAVTHMNDEVLDVCIDDLSEDMTLEEHVFTATGDVMIPAGRQITGALLDRLNNFRSNGCEIREPIRVRRPIVKSAELVNK